MATIAAKLGATGLRVGGKMTARQVGKQFSKQMVKGAAKKIGKAAMKHGAKQIAKRGGKEAIKKQLKGAVKKAVKDAVMDGGFPGLKKSKGSMSSSRSTSRSSSKTSGLSSGKSSARSSSRSNSKSSALSSSRSSSKSSAPSTSRSSSKSSAPSTSRSSSKSGAPSTSRSSNKSSKVSSSDVSTKSSKSVKRKTQEAGKTEKIKPGSEASPASKKSSTKLKESPVVKNEGSKSPSKAKKNDETPVAKRERSKSTSKVNKNKADKKGKRSIGSVMKAAKSRGTGSIKNTVFRAAGPTSMDAGVVKNAVVGAAAPVAMGAEAVKNGVAGVAAPVAMGAEAVKSAVLGAAIPAAVGTASVAAAAITRVRPGGKREPTPSTDHSESQAEEVTQTTAQTMSEIMDTALLPSSESSAPSVEKKRRFSLPKIRRLSIGSNDRQKRFSGGGKGSFTSSSVSQVTAENRKLKEYEEIVAKHGQTFPSLRRLKQAVDKDVINQEAANELADSEFNLMLFRLAKHLIMDDAREARAQRRIDRGKKKKKTSNADWLQALGMILRADRHKRTDRRRKRQHKVAKYCLPSTVYPYPYCWPSPMMPPSCIQSMASPETPAYIGPNTSTSTSQVSEKTVPNRVITTDKQNLESKSGQSVTSQEHQNGQSKIKPKHRKESDRSSSLDDSSGSSFTGSTDSISFSSSPDDKNGTDRLLNIINVLRPKRGRSGRPDSGQGMTPYYAPWCIDAYPLPICPSPVIPMCPSGIPPCDGEWSDESRMYPESPHFPYS